MLIVYTIQYHGNYSHLMARRYTVWNERCCQHAKFGSDIHDWLLCSFFTDE